MRVLGRFKNIFGSDSGKGGALTGAVDYIVAGLGNPGKQYEKTRHNAGYMAVDLMSSQLEFPMKKLRFKSLCGECMISGKRVLFMKPTTYMNNSGEAVREAAAYYKIPMERIIVISDDVSLDVGKMRIRRQGSDGGQKGLRSIINLTGRDNFPRIRIGVGQKPHPDMPLADWVLSRFTKPDIAALTAVLENTKEAVELIVSDDIQAAMNKFN